MKYKEFTVCPNDKADNTIKTVIGFLIPQPFKMPVQGVTIKSYSQDSYWFYPWGKSITHKGVGILSFT
jgi:hypothetical protein